MGALHVLVIAVLTFGMLATAEAQHPSASPSAVERSSWAGEVSYQHHVGQVEFDLERRGSDVRGRHHFSSETFNINNLEVSGTIDTNGVVKLRIPGLSSWASFEGVIRGDVMSGTYVGRVGTPFPLEARRKK